LLFSICKSASVVNASNSALILLTNSSILKYYLVFSRLLNATNY
jgi:hypothetical protein